MVKLQRQYFCNPKSWIVYVLIIAIVVTTVSLCVYFFSKTSEIVSNTRTLNSVWHWECTTGYCVKRQIPSGLEGTALSLPACRLICSEYASLWPQPTGSFSVGNNRTLEKLNINNIKIVGYTENSPSTELFQSATQVFKSELQTLTSGSENSDGKSIVLNIHVENSSIYQLTLDVDESYTLNVTQSDEKNVEIYISGSNFFGVRHGLTTLTQLIVLDDLRNEVVILTNVFISDAPVYPIRGVLLDTSRNYVSVETIKSIFRGMSVSKLNTFHWHITDSQSFPYDSKSYPELSKYGAYSAKQVYTNSIVQELTEYAVVRGIRILPEIDSPAHVGEGWQNTGLVTCFNWQPWYLYCVAPPCGQFDPTNDTLYDVLEGLFTDISEQFDIELFHIGGDEVNFNCWNSTQNIVAWMEANNYELTEEGFIKLRIYYQEQYIARLYKQLGKEVPLIIWQSSLTDQYLNYLSNEQFIVHIWSDSSALDNILDNNFKVIISIYNPMYLDCGFASWYWEGSNWCSPYNGWQEIYDKTPESFVGTRKNLILGNIVALWTETADSASIDNRMWPRAAAMAEAVWTEPSTGWQAAEHRFLIHRERLIKMGINADSVEPTWCHQNEENCRVNSHFFQQGNTNN